MQKEGKKKVGGSTSTAKKSNATRTTKKKGGGDMPNQKKSNATTIKKEVGTTTTKKKKEVGTTTKKNTWSGGATTKNKWGDTNLISKIMKKGFSDVKFTLESFKCTKSGGGPNDGHSRYYQTDDYKKTGIFSKNYYFKSSDEFNKIIIDEILVTCDNIHVDVVNPSNSCYLILTIGNQNSTYYSREPFNITKNFFDNLGKEKEKCFRHYFDRWPFNPKLEFTFRTVELPENIQKIIDESNIRR